MKRKDASTQGLYALISDKVRKWKTMAVGPEGVKIPSDHRVRKKVLVAGTFPVPVTDEDMGDAPFASKAANRFLGRLPIVDHDLEWGSLADARALLHAKFGLKAVYRVDSPLEALRLSRRQVFSEGLH